MPLIESDSWIVPVIYGSDQRTLLLTDYMQRAGLETSIVQYPVVPRHLSRMRLFVTSEHTPEQIERAAEIIIAAARHRVRRARPQRGPVQRPKRLG